MSERTVAALVADLIFESRIRGAARAAGTGVRIVRTAEALRDEAATATGVLIDLNTPGVDGPALIGGLRRDRMGLRIVAFLSHVQRELAEAARRAGADEVLPRSALASKLGAVLGRLSGASGAEADRPQGDAPGPSA